ncbi:MAG TPA: AAA family ATPase [Candidatus Limnocylindrales bacterium]|nr:AAA family ATPase [Candidatus Limnocylindrales bacterium]
MPSNLSSPILVGRATELAVLDVALRRAVAGEASVVLIGGDAGLGKSRLIAEFATGARASDARVLIGGCIDLGGDGLPYGPFLEALRELAVELPPAELSALIGDIAPELVALVPQFATYLAVDPTEASAGAPAPAPAPAAAPAPAQAGQGRLFELTMALISRLSAERPLVIGLEDLHWSDPATRDLLAFLARNLRRNRVLLVGTYRTDDLERGHPLLVRLAELARLPNVDRIDLRPLDIIEQASQLAGILGRKPARGLVERIHARAQGNPFFAEELIASETGTTERRSTDLVPRSLRDILLARVAALGRETQRVLGVASVAGTRTDDRLLAAVTGLDDDTLVNAIREAVAHQVLETDERTATYRFRHALLSEVTHADLLPGERQRLHEAVAEYLVAAEQAGEPIVAAELAHHWLVAERPREALTASVDAARSATGVHAHADAHRHLERALSLVDRVADSESLLGMDRISLLTLASDAADRAGASQRAVELARTALEYLGHGGDPALEGIIRSRLAYYLWLTGDSPASIAEHRAAVAVVPAEPPSVERARVLGGLASILMPTGHYRESREIAEEALRVLHETESREGEGRLLNVLGVDLVGLGEVELGLGHLREAVRAAREANELENQLGAIHNLAFFLAQTDRFEEGIGVAMDGLEAAKRVGLLRRYGANLRATAGDILHRSGRWDEADQITREGLDLDIDSSGSIYLRATRAMYQSARGQLESAGDDLAAADALAAGGDVDPDVQAYLLQAHAEMHLVSGRPADALRSVENAIAQYAGSDEYLLVAPLIADGMAAAADLAEHGRAFRDPGEVETATAAATSLRALARTIDERTRETSAATPSLQAVVATAEAEWSRLEGSSDASAWMRAAEAWDAVPMPYPAARARARAGEAILLARGPRDEAARHLRAAHRATTDLGAAPLRASIEAIATRARIDLTADERAAADAAEKSAAVAAAAAKPPGERSPAEILGLSAREWEVLELVAAGRSNAEIAETLYISPKTASVHVTHILDKLGVNNRVEAATIAVRVGAGEARPGA